MYNSKRKRQTKDDEFALLHILFFPVTTHLFMAIYYLCAAVQSFFSSFFSSNSSFCYKCINPASIFMTRTVV